MNELPVLVLLKVLDYLPTVDAIRCRAVCKSWRATIDEFVLDELNAFHGERQHSKYLQLRKCFTNPNRSISFDKPSLERLVLNNDQFAFLFRNLKKFSFIQHNWFLMGYKNYGELEKLINTFVNLEHLYLVSTSLISIKLAKLKTYDCLNWSKQTVKVRKLLDCPELQALAIDYEETETLVPNCPKLRYLKYTQYSPWVSRLDSLEVLNLWELENSEDILRNHPKLHTLNVFNVAKTVLEELVRSKREMGRDHLKTFFRSLPVDGEVLEAFDQIFDLQRLDPRMHALSCFTAKGVELYAKHEHKFRDDFYVFNNIAKGVLIYKDTIANLKLLTNRTQILRKIRHAHSLHIGDVGPFSQQDVVDLMKEMPNVNDFDSLDVDLDQAFFDQLPTILKHLNILRIWKADTRDLSFILRFRDLVQFVTNGYVPSDHNTRVKAAFDKNRALDFAS